jgi:alkylation response protein AidB-like acyl-CoA dehydrogenase
MRFGLNESQKSLKDNARKFFSINCSMKHVRQCIETETAYDATLWQLMAEQGYMGIGFPEEYDGVGLGNFELNLILEEAGRALLPGPFFSTVALAGSVFDAAGTPDQKKKYLSPICRGEARSTVAILESDASWNPSDVRTVAENGRVTGEKLFVPDAAVADWIVVVASAGVFVVDPKSSSVTIQAMPSMDLTRKLYAVKFNSSPGEKLGNSTGLARGLDTATVALVAEMVGGMQQTLDITVQYAKTRAQFGKIIGSFQAVQHQCADMYLETESARSAAYYAGWKLQDNSPDTSTAVSIAKSYASDVCRTVGNRGIQVHGGMGFTWENDLHLYYRRAKASETMLGDAAFHRERIARRVIDSPTLPDKSA